ncbi:hypothetical protein Tco_1458774 [Tanacetum coccineum]
MIRDLVKTMKQDTPRTVAEKRTRDRKQNRSRKSIINGITCETRFKEPRRSRPEYKCNRFRSVNEDEEDVLGPITIMSEIKDAVQDEKLQGRMLTIAKAIVSYAKFYSKAFDSLNWEFVMNIIEDSWPSFETLSNKKEMEPAAAAAACASMAALAAASLAVIDSACASNCTIASFDNPIEPEGTLAVDCLTIEKLKMVGPIVPLATTWVVSKLPPSPKVSIGVVLSTPKFGRIHLCKQKQLATMDYKLLIFNSLDDSQPRRSFCTLDCETLNVYRSGDDDNDDDSYEWVACDLWRLDGDGDGSMKVTAFPHSHYHIKDLRYRIITTTLSGNWFAIAKDNKNNKSFRKVSMEDFATNYWHFNHPGVYILSNYIF